MENRDKARLIYIYMHSTGLTMHVIDIVSLVMLPYGYKLITAAGKQGCWPLPWLRIRRWVL